MIDENCVERLYKDAEDLFIREMRDRSYGY